MKRTTSEQTKLARPSGNQLSGVAQWPGKVFFHVFKLAILFLGIGFKDKKTGEDDKISQNTEMLPLSFFIL